MRMGQEKLRGAWKRGVVGGCANLLLVSALAAQPCAPEWLPGIGVPGPDYWATALTRWDADGAGPEPERLIVGGRFRFVGTVFSPGVAAWEPTTGQWSEVGGGVPGFAAYEGVEEVAVWQGDLIAAGDFWRAGDVLASNIARFDGAQWHTLGPGLNGRVWVLTEAPSGELLAGGEFTSGGVSVNRIARWDGATWKPIGPGPGGFDAPVHALKVLANGDLVAGGAFSAAGSTTASRIARWDGSKWNALGDGLSGTVNAIEQMPYGWIVVGGEFKWAGSNPALTVALWDGSSWLAVGPGLGTGQTYEQVTTLRVQPNGTLLAAGSFFESGGVPVRAVASWDGTTWTQVGNGLGTPCSDIEPLPSGGLIAAGLFSTLPPVGDNVAILKNGQWSKMADGTDSSVYALGETSNGELIVGGYFKTISGVSANGVALWDGSVWNPMDGGVGVFDPSGYESTSVLAVLGLSDGSVAVGGNFSKAGELKAGDIAIWRRGEWDTLNGGFPQTSQSTAVLAMIDRPDGLYVAGQFKLAGTVATCAIARWTDGGGWSAVGSGDCASPNSFSSVSRMALLGNGDLLVYGNGIDASGKAVSLARWNGATFQMFGDNPSISVQSMLVTPGDLVTIGQAFGLLRWDGVGWWPIATGLKGFGDDGPSINSLAAGAGDAIIAAGSFQYAGKSEANSIASWDGTSWHAFETGLASLGVAQFAYGTALLRRANGELVVGGTFTEAGNKANAYLARWGCPPTSCYPDCDESGSLDIDDFICFQTRFAINDPAADCDANASLDIDDFICFQTAFAIGC